MTAPTNTNYLQANILSAVKAAYSRIAEPDLKALTWLPQEQNNVVAFGRRRLAGSVTADVMKAVRSSTLQRYREKLEVNVFQVYLGSSINTGLPDECYLSPTDYYSKEVVKEHMYRSFDNYGSAQLNIDRLENKGPDGLQLTVAYRQDNEPVIRFTRLFNMNKLMSIQDYATPESSTGYWMPRQGFFDKYRDAVTSERHDDFLNLL